MDAQAVQVLCLPRPLDGDEIPGWNLVCSRATHHLDVPLTVGLLALRPERLEALCTTCPVRGPFLVLQFAAGPADLATPLLTKLG